MVRFFVTALLLLAAFGLGVVVARDSLREEAINYVRSSLRQKNASDVTDPIAREIGQDQEPFWRRWFAAPRPATPAPRSFSESTEVPQDSVEPLPDYSRPLDRPWVEPSKPASGKGAIARQEGLPAGRQPPHRPEYRQPGRSAQPPKPALVKNGKKDQTIEDILRKNP